MLNELVHLTADCVKNTLAVDVAEHAVLVSAIAQRVVNPAVKIDAVVAWAFEHASFRCHADIYIKSREEAYESSGVPLGESSTNLPFFVRLLDGFPS